MHPIFQRVQKSTDTIRNEHNFLFGEGGYTLTGVPWFTKAIYSMRTVNKAKILIQNESCYAKNRHKLTLHPTEN
jgi:hypothetical protein